ncbi:potassium channel family protein [Clostridium novyi]|uniref:potassium channel family protein n=1 Tax=Clostridium novyi TaxID=1542 RepID=UPI000908075D|nr:potassium channel family protein [Clostridium novyi]
MLENFETLSNNRPLWNLDTYLRMIYLSCVTITTLGFGDIVPLTNITRLLISLESILGIVIIGLAVNTMFNKISEK